MRNDFSLAQMISVLLFTVLIAYALAIVWPLYKTNVGMKDTVADSRERFSELDAIKQNLTGLRRDYRYLYSAYQAKMEALNQPDCLEGAYAKLLSLLNQYRIDTITVDRLEGKPFQFEKSAAHAIRYQLTMKLVGSWRGYFGFRQNLFRDSCLLQVMSEKISAQKRGDGVKADLRLYIFEFEPEEAYV